MNFNKSAYAFAALLALAGCAAQRFDFVDTPVTVSPTLEEGQTFWVSGIGQTTEIDAAKTCGDASKVIRIETQQTAGDVGLSLITLGIYTPRHIRVTCK